MTDQDAGLMSAYAEHDRRVRLRYSKAACVLVALLVPAGVSLDYFVYPHLATEFFVARLIVSALTVAILGLHYTTFGELSVRWLGVVPPLLTNIAICWMIYAVGEASSPYYAGLNLVLFGIAVLLPWTLFEALLVAGVTLALYLLASFSASPGETEWSTFYNNVYFLVLASIICCTSAFMKSRGRLAEFKLQAELTRTNAELTRLERLKTQFFGNISHELRTPLTLILSPLEDALRNSTRPGTESGSGVSKSENAETRLLQVAHRNALRLLKLINELLEFVRLDAAELTRRSAPLELSEFLRGQAESVEHLAKLQGLTLTVDLPNLETWVNVDRAHLEKIVVNLLTNAIKYTFSGGQVRLKLSRSKEYALVHVEDTGVGVAQEDLKIIFDRFRQAEHSPRAGAGGIGIGLALASELAQENGGRLSAISEVGRGTTMLLELPLVDAPASSLEPTPIADDPVSSFSRKAERDYLQPLAVVPPQPGSALTALDSLQTRTRILVVDDEPDMRGYIVSSLAHNYEVSEARSGQEALALIGSIHPDLLVLDLMMPQMSGIEVCERLQQVPEAERPRVLMLTAQHEDETKLDALAHGADDFLTKPFSVPELNLRIHNLLRARRLERELRDHNIQLAQTLKQLKQAETKLVESEKFSALGRMAGGLLHELNNPLNYAGTAISLAKERVPASEPMLREIISDVEEGLERVQAVISEVRSFANPAASTRHETLKLARIAKQAVTLAKPDLNGIEVRVTVPEDLSVSGAEVQLVHVLGNLLSNAGDAIRTSRVGGEIRISAHITGDRAQVEVSDDGPGIAPDVLETVLDPFVTTKPPGQGTGLGLAICDRFVKNHGGSIRITTAHHAGTSLSFDLPLPTSTPTES